MFKLFKRSNIQITRAVFTGIKGLTDPIILTVFFNVAREISSDDHKNIIEKCRRYGGKWAKNMHGCDVSGSGLKEFNLSDPKKGFVSFANNVERGGKG